MVVMILLPDCKFVIYLQVESGMLRWKSLSCRSSGIIVLKVELKFTNRMALAADASN